MIRQLLIGFQSFVWFLFFFGKVLRPGAAADNCNDSFTTTDSLDILSLELSLSLSVSLAHAHTISFSLSLSCIHTPTRTHTRTWKGNHNLFRSLAHTRTLLFRCTPLLKPLSPRTTLHSNAFPGWSLDFSLSLSLSLSHTHTHSLRFQIQGL